MPYIIRNSFIKRVIIKYYTIMKKEKLIQVENYLKQYFKVVEHIGCLFYCEQMFNSKAYGDILFYLRTKSQLPISLIVLKESCFLSYYGDLHYAENLFSEFSSWSRPVKDGKIWRWHSCRLEKKATPEEIFNAAV